jgi:hypothetical protein
MRRRRRRDRPTWQTNGSHNELPPREGPRVNEEIRVPQVRLIDQEGEMVGVMSAREALIRAYEVGLDLLEISPNAAPPVVKILDYGKYKYEQQKKANQGSDAARRQGGSGAPPGRDFERRVAERLGVLGWDVSLTRGSGDGGVDVICRCGAAVLVVQCKDWANPVGFSAVQEIHTARDLQKASLAAVVSANSFTQAARDAAPRLNVLLLTLHELQPGCQIDRTKEGDRIRAQRRARAEAEAAEEARQRAMREASERRAAEEALAEEWRRYDSALAEHERRLAARGDKLTYVGMGGLTGGLGLIWLGQSHPWWASILAGIAVVVGWNYVAELYRQRPPKPPAQARNGASQHLPGASTAKDAAFGTERRVVPCVYCGQLLRLPARTNGLAKCPSCGKSAWYET